MELNWKKVDKLIKMAFEEDLGKGGDITSKALIPEKKRSTGIFMSKDTGTVAGIPVIERCYKVYGADVEIEKVKNDGERIVVGDVILYATGNTRDLLAVERTALNFLGHLSGIASLTYEVVQALKPTGTVLMDTRKTTPGLRELEKYAASVGGAANHRIGLYDGVLIKENHIVVAGGIKQAIERIEKEYPGAQIEVEAKSLDELRQAISAGAHVVMLDNVPLKQIKQAVKQTHGEIQLEASGGITVDNVDNYAKTGIQYISMGQITADAARVDISFLLD